MGEAVDQDFLRASGLRIKENGTLEVDRYTLETSRSKFYAGGDLISGASNVSNAMGYGKKAARIVDERLMGVYRWPDVFPQFEYNQSPPEQVCEARRHHGRAIPPSARMMVAQASACEDTFPEVVLALDPEDALEEANRCLRCDVKTIGVHQ